MATLVIKLAPGTPNYRQRTVLDGVPYLLDFRWSQREERWYLDLRNAAGDLLAGAIKLVVNYPLLASRRGARDEMPPGDLRVVDGRESPADPGLDELGDTHQLVYTDAATATEELGAA
jgi:hypothetical protein